MPNILVQPIHFEDFSGVQFERLVFAFLLRTEEWEALDWYGQLGSDRGRDIWGVLSNRWGASKVCYQCANRRRLTFRKVQEDLNKICAGPNEVPNKFIVVTGGSVSAAMKNQIFHYAKSKNIDSSEVWSGNEFEEKLRRDTPAIIRRFCEGETFPESVTDLALFASEESEMDTRKVLSAYASCFDRPAFTTPFHMESNLPHFKKAITDTIEALQTGVHRLRDGTIIKRFPAINEIAETYIREKLREIVIDLQKLRHAYDELCQRGEVKPCDCGQVDCPVHCLSWNACRIMDELRRNILDKFRSIHPRFEVRSWG